jgi:hypothetical protein
MKHIALIFFVLSSCKVSVGQELITIRDTINHFSIGVPVGWIYGVPTDKSVTFAAYRQKLNGPNWPKENFNINIIRRGDKDLEKTYKEFLAAIGKVNGFLIIDQADTVINGRRYKSLIETHINPLNNERLHNYVLFANNNGKILILTMVTTSSNFETFKTLFDTIALSLSY